MDGQTIVDEVKRYGFGDEADYSDAEILAVVNVVEQEINNIAPWPYLQRGPTIVPITSGQAYAALPGDFNKPISLTVGVTKLGWLDTGEYIQHVLTAGTGLPQHYTIYHEQLRFAPVPNAAASAMLWYQATSPVVTLASEPASPERYHYLHVWGTLIRLFEGGHDDGSGAATAEQRYLSLLEIMKSDLLRVELDKTEALTSTYTLANIFTEVRGHGFSELGNSILMLWANTGIAEIEADEGPFPWQYEGPVDLAVTAGDALVSLPEDAARPLQIMGTNTSLVHERLDVLWAREMQGSGVLTAHGEPTHYSVYGSDSSGYPQIRLFPTPQTDATLSLFYIKNSGTISTITTPPPWPKRHHRILVLYILIRACQWSGSPEDRSRCEVFQGEYARAKEIMRHDMSQTQQDNQDQIVPDFEIYQPGFE